MTEANSQENNNDIITSINYDENNSVYQRIRKEFMNKLKDKYDCQDYDVIVNYVFDLVFKKKFDKAQSIEKLDPYFNNKAADIVNYLWNITKEAEEDERIKTKNKDLIEEKENVLEVIVEIETKEIKNMKIIKCNRKDIILLKDTCNLR